MPIPLLVAGAIAAGTAIAGGSAAAAITSPARQRAERSRKLLSGMFATTKPFEGAARGIRGKGYLSMANVSRQETDEEARMQGAGTNPFLIQELRNQRSKARNEQKAFIGAAAERGSLDALAGRRAELQHTIDTTPSLWQSVKEGASLGLATANTAANLQGAGSGGGGGGGGAPSPTEIEDLSVLFE